MTKNKYLRSIFSFFITTIFFAVVAFITYDSESSDVVWISFIAVLIAMISFVYTLFIFLYYVSRQYSN